MNRPELTEEPDTIDQKAEWLVRIAQTLASDWPRFAPLLKPEDAGRAVSAFKAELRSRAFAELCQNYASKRICGNSGANAPAVDYHLGGTVVEVALGLREEDGAFERGILKAIMAQSAGHPVSRLIFLAKAGARFRCASPFRSAVTAWVRSEHGLEVEVRELGPAGENIFDPADE